MKPYLFDEFFASGREESISPFLTPASRRWGKNLPLKSASFSALLFVFSLGFSFFHPTLSALFLVPVYFLVGVPALIDTIEDLTSLEINIDVLMTLAALLSVLIGSALEGALLLVLFELSAALENMVTHKTKSALIQLNHLSPRLACVVAADGTLFERSVREIGKDTLLLVKPGEIVPLDGEVLEGKSSVNLSHLTGESLPVFKQRGDEVPAGALNLEGALTVKVTRSSEGSTLKRIIDLITTASEAKPKLVTLIDRFSKTYATSVILLFLLFAATLPLYLSIPYLGTEGGIYRALTFLIAASPCALILATPTAYLSAISSCTKRGILLKGGAILDALAGCKKIAFDKTGTLTTGELQCLSFERLTGPHKADLALTIALGLERNAVHPIAKAIVRYAEKNASAPHAVQNFISIPGLGVEADVLLVEGKRRAYLGSSEFIRGKNPELKLPAHQEGRLSTFLLVGDSLFHFQFADTLRPDATAAVRELKKTHKLTPIMLTGDHLASARPVAKTLEIEELHADLLPQDKLAKVAELSKEEGLIMVGDGINDAPALARATVGVSLGRVSSATATLASDIVLLHEDLSLLPWLIRKARSTRTILKQNLTLALIVILFATTPALLGLIPLWAAVLLHEGGTILVGLNSLRLLKSRI